MINRFFLWLYFLAIVTYLIIKIEMQADQASDDPSAMAVWGFLPFLVPLFVMESAKLLVIPYVVSEVFIWATNRKEVTE